MLRCVGSMAVWTLASACWWGGDDLPVAANLALVAETDLQRGFAGAQLPIPLAVTATDADGRNVARTRVRWAVVGGAGADLSDSVTVADGAGRATVTVTLGRDPAVVQIRARLADKPDAAVTFFVEGLVPPVVTSLNPSSFAGGDTVTLLGTGLSDSLPVEIAGVRAIVLEASVTGRGVFVVVPTCLPTGPVPVLVRFPGGASEPVIGTYQGSSVPVTLAVGGYRSFDPAAMDGCAVFPAAGPGGAEYLLVPQAATGLVGASAGFRLEGGVTITAAPRPAPPAPEPAPFALRFHEFLRRQEAAIAKLPRPVAPPQVPEAIAEVKVGDRRSFRVCSSVDCQELEDFTEVKAVAKYVGEHAAIFQDQAAPDTLTPADFESLGRTFDLDLYEVATDAFGADSDIDRNGKVIILMTPVVNGLTPEADCGTSIVTGFFFAIDIDPRFQNDGRSNKGEVFYALTPDGAGAAGCAHPLSRIRNLVPVTFVHELQHMISYHQHVLLRDGDAEALWLNEGMSHLAEELAAHHYQALGNQERFSQFALGDIYNAYRFLRFSPGNFVAWQEGTGTLPERGGAWLFLRWLVDRFGIGIVRRMEESALTGDANVARAAAEPFSSLVSEWFLATYASDLPDFVAPPRLRYSTWTLRYTYQSLHEQAPDRFDLPFPIVPTEVNPNAFALTGTLHAASGEYVVAVQAPGSAGFTLRFLAPSGGPVDPAVTPRLSMLRIR